MRGLSWAARNEAVLSISITATMCCSADVGHLAVVDDLRFAGGEAHDHRLHLIGGRSRALEQGFQRFQRRLDGRADGPLLDVGARDLVALAELVDQLGGIGLGRMGLQEIVRPGEDVVDAGAAGWTSNAAVTPLRAGMPANTKDFSMCSVSRVPCAEPGACCAV